MMPSGGAWESAASLWESRQQILVAAQGSGANVAPRATGHQAHTARPAQGWEVTRKGSKDFVLALGGMCRATVAAEKGGEV